MADSKKIDLMDGIFDFNGDGHTDMGEEFIAYLMYEEMCNKKTDNPAPFAVTKKAGNVFSGDDLWTETADYDDTATVDQQESGFHLPPIDDPETSNKAAENNEARETVPFIFNKDKSIFERRMFVLFCVSVCIGLIWLINAIFVPKPARLPADVQKLFNEGKYRESALLCEDEHFSDWYIFSVLCRAFIEEGDGDIDKARNLLRSWDDLSQQLKSIIPEDIIEQAEALKDKIDQELIDREKQTQAASYTPQANSTTIQVNHTESTSADVPYRGMSESRIGSTSLGAPSRSEFINNKFGDGKLRFYYWDKGGKTIFVARTENGVVRSTTDNRKGKLNMKAPK